MIYKVIWVIRGVFYKLLFGKFSLPSYIGKPIFINNFKQIYIGKRVRIFPGARIECIGKQAKIIINDNISIGHNLHITAASILEIGGNTTISANVIITDIAHEYQIIDMHIMDQPLLVNQTRIGENCFIGYGAVIDAGTILGKHCVVGANCVVKGDFPDYSVIAGVPGKIIKYYNHNSKSWERYEN